MAITSKLSPFVRVVLGALAVASGAAHAGVPLPHNQVKTIRQDVTNYQWRFQPHLRVAHGCVPFPAVDWDGNTNNGLKNSGAHNGECGKSTGQVYVRALWYGGYCAVMYAWYFPKDRGIGGHRHDWENAVVWLSECSANANVLAVSYSGHGSYYKTRSPNMLNERPLIEYGTSGLLNHQLFETRHIGGFQPAIRWMGLPFNARVALTYTSFGAAAVPFTDKTFLRNLDKAYPGRR